MSTRIAILAVILCGASGAPGLFLRPGSAASQRIATALALSGSLLGIGAVVAALMLGEAGFVARWSLPGAEITASIDGLSAVFLLPLFVVSALGAVYGEAYWPEHAHPTTGRRLRFFYGAMTAGIALVLLARNGMLFLFGWEIMALSGFVLIATEDHEPAAAEASLIYLVATHTATLALFALFALLHSATGSFALAALPPGVASSPIGRAIFLLGLFGFGIKAGLMPLHVWLPPAHAAAPSHVSALMSGVLIKTGLYGIARLVSLFPDPPLWWGGVVLALGVVSGVLGVAFALGQHDLKRLLAYHSVENVGIIAMGLGVSLIGRTLGRPEWVALGLAGAALHVVNHALFKSLLFFGAGSVVHATGTREMDQLGGLARAMPRTALAFFVGAAAICGLPPLNGFVSEWLIYLGLFRAAGGTDHTVWLWASLALPALALIGALALACFVKAFGVVFLGEPRSARARAAHESGRPITGAMAVGAACCVFIGLAPMAVAPLLDRAVAAAAPGLAVPAVGRVAPFGAISLFGCALAVVALALAIFTRSRLRASPVTATGTWDCGYAAPAPTMQYTSSSFADTAVGFFRWALFPRAHAPGPLGLFARPASFESHVPDTVLDRALYPAVRAAVWLLSWARYLQRGSIQLYLLYIAVTLLVLLWRV